MENLEIIIIKNELKIKYPELQRTINPMWDKFGIQSTNRSTVIHPGTNKPIFGK